jgi:hypothetical protein
MPSEVDDLGVYRMIWTAMNTARTIAPIVIITANLSG